MKFGSQSYRAHMGPPPRLQDNFQNNFLTLYPNILKCLGALLKLKYISTLRPMLRIRLWMSSWRIEYDAYIHVLGDENPILSQWVSQSLSTYHVPNFFIRWKFRRLSWPSGKNGILRERSSACYYRRCSIILWKDWVFLFLKISYSNWF